MEGGIIGILIWSACGILLAVLGVCAFFAKKEVGFWANVKPIAVTDVRGYNRAVGKLFIIGGLAFILLGLPMLKGQNTAGIVLSMLGIVFGSLAMMIVYTVGIEGKYRKK